MGVELAFLATCDLVGLVRGRALKAPLTESSNVGWVAVPSGEFHLRGVEGESNLSVHLANQYLPDGTLWNFCPRGIAEKAVADLKNEFQLDLIASFEHEFILLGKDSSGSAFGLDSF